MGLMRPETAIKVFGELKPTLVVAKAWYHIGIYALESLILGFGQLAFAPLLTGRVSISEFGSYEILVVTHTAIRALFIIPMSSALVYGYCWISDTHESRDQ